MAEHSVTHEVILPSRGILNPEIPEGKIVQRCMMVSDQKYLAASKSENKMQEMIRRTIVSPENIDVGLLTVTDTLFLLFKLRILSYGNNYTYTQRCPRCGDSISVTVDLSELPYDELSSDYEKSLEVKLPVSGDTVQTRLLTNQVSESIHSEIKKAQKRNKDYQDGFVVRLSALIKSIKLAKPNKEGVRELTDIFDIRAYVEDLTDYDATAIESVTSSIKYGIVPVIDYVCPSCGSDIGVDIVFDTEFFRPKFNR